MKTLNDYKEEYNKLETKKNLRGREALEAVKLDGLALQYVKEQTEEICLAAVRQDGYALCYVKEQTEEICLEAVKRNVYALQFVKEQTEEICLAALKWDVCALQYVNEDLFKNEEIIELNGVRYKKI